MPTLSGFFPFDGHFGVQPQTVKASTTFAQGQVLAAENAGTTGELTGGATDDFLLAVYNDKPVTAADSDYASIKTKNVWLVQHGPSQLWKARVSTGTAATATEGWDYADIVSGGLSLTLTDTNKDFRIIRVLDGTASNGVVVGYFASFTTEPTA